MMTAQQDKAKPSNLWRAALLAMFGFVPFGSSLPGLLLLVFERPLAWVKGEGRLTEAEAGYPPRVLWTIRLFLGLWLFAAIGGLFSLKPWEALANAAACGLAILLLISGGMRCGRSLPFLAGVCLPVLTAGALISSLLNIFRYFYYHLDRVANIIPQNPNATGTLIVITAGLGLAWLLRQKNFWRHFTLPFLVIIGANLVLTGSRGALLGFTTMLAAVACCRRRFIIIILMLALIYSVAINALPGLTERLRDPASLKTRIEIWRITARIILDHPLFGVGAGQYQSVYNRYVPPVKPEDSMVFAHNLFLQMAAEFGLPALAVFLAIICLLLGICIRLARTGEAVYQCILAVIVGVLVHLQFDNTIWGLDIGGVFWLLIGMSLGFYLSHLTPDLTPNPFPRKYRVDLRGFWRIVLRSPRVAPQSRPREGAP